jgi:predicted glycosyltransferase
MRILIDIGHPAQLNFLKIPIIYLSQHHNLFVSYINRGKLGNVIKKELINIDIKLIEIGKHNGTIFSIMWDANIRRFVHFVKFIYLNKIEIGVNGGFSLGLAMKILHGKYIQFDDDYERKLVICLEKLSADRLYLFPSTINLKYKRNSNVYLVNALKEWAYLSPKYFSPNASVLNEYNLAIGNYIFIREVNTKTINYMCQKQGLISTYKNAINSMNLKVLLSLEDKEKRINYPEDWILLQEPVNNIHSLMYYAYCVISSGDSMAREGAMLGVKSIYCGSRDMEANRFLIDRSNFIWAKNYADFVTAIKSDLLIDQEIVRLSLLDKWIDVNNLVIEAILSTKGE